jgi:hypothetical protein
MKDSLAPQSIPGNADPVTVAEGALWGLTHARLKVSIEPTTDATSPAAPREPVNRLKTSASSIGDSQKSGSTKKSG